MPHLADLEKCVGCTACASICPQQCISIAYDNAGFTYPLINNTKKCVECNRCEMVCPIITSQEITEQKICAYAAYSKDKSIREKSSSGGIFSELAISVLAENGIVFGASYNELWNVNHIAVSDIGDLDRLRGAKYSESKLENSYVEVKYNLKKGKKVLFSGTPCQVAGLKSFLGYDDPNLLCVDFVCHGIPSPKAWEAYIAERKKKDNSKEDPIVINLRAKDSGWSYYKYSYLFEYPSGIKYINMNGNDIYMKLFCNDYILRKSCETCQFKGYKRVSDITLGDFWGIWDIMPEMDDNKGTSLVLTHSDKGERILDKIANRIMIKETILNLAAKENPSLLISAKAKKAREEILNEVCSGNFVNAYKIFSKKEGRKNILEYIKLYLKWNK